MHHPHLNPEFSLQPKSKSWFLTEAQMKFVTAALSLAGVLAALYAHQRKDVIIVAIAVPAVVLVMSVIPGIISGIASLYRREEQQEVVRVEYPRLQRFYQRLSSFTDQNNGRSLRHILYSASAYRHDIVDKILGSDYITTWIECYGARLNMERPRSFLGLLHESNELTAILSEYNRHYAHRIQKGMQQTPLEQEHIIDQLEQFRDDFNHYLREVEEWATGISAAAMKMLPDATSHLRIFPCTFFEKVKTFRRAKATV